MPVIILLAFAAGCNNDFMERVPPDKINDANFWKKPSDLKSYANQFYPSLIDANTFWRADNQSDNQCPSSLDGFIWGQYVVPSSGGGWAKSDWAQIRSCNYFLKQYRSVEGNPDEINTYVAEVYFFKAFFYYQKLRQFGDVPWLNDVLQINSEALMAPRDSRKIVADSIAFYLDKAAGYLPDTSPEGRVTRYAALALKSRVCLFEGTYRKYRDLGDHEKMLQASAAAARDVMSSAKFGVYTTGDAGSDYYNLFVAENLANNPEAIMVRTYATDKLMHNLNRILSEPQTGFSKDFAESYLCKDGKPIAVSPLYKGDAKFSDEFIDRDPRMLQTIYTADRPILVTAAGEARYQEVPEFNNQRCNTGYRIVKFYSPKERDLEQGRSVKPVFVFRYSEVLLNYAEALAELNSCTQAVLDESVNLLRARVGMPKLKTEVGYTDPSWPKWEVAVSPLINEIRRERRVELAAEGFRFDDIRRWKAGVLLENVKTYSGARDPQTNAYRTLYPGNVRSWKNKLYLYPIPSIELTLNPQIRQNPEW